MVSPDKTKVAFIGCGVMGNPVAGNILAAGYDITVCDRMRDKTSNLVASGASLADSVREACLGADVIFTMVAYPEDVEDLYLGDHGVIDSARPGCYLVDLTTSSPRLAQEIGAMGAVNDLHVLDCPVTGGEMSAREATLTAFVGGEEGDLADIMPLLDCFAEEIHYMGGAGMGQMAKLAHQIALAESISGAFESMAFAKQAGLDPERLRATMLDGRSSSWALESLVPRAVADDYLSGLQVEHFIKDLGLALDIADELNLTLPGLETAYQLYDLLSIVGGSTFGPQGLALLYEDEKTCSAHGLDWARAEEYENYYGGQYDEEAYDEDYDDRGHYGDHDHFDDEHGHDHHDPHRDFSGGDGHMHRGGPGMLGMGGFFSEN